MLRLFVYKCIKNEVGCRDDTVSKTVEMKGTEVLTLGAVGVLNLYTEVHVHTTKLFWPATYTSSWASYFSRLAMVAPPVHILMSEWCGVIIRAGYAFMFTFHV